MSSDSSGGQVDDDQAVGAGGGGVAREGGDAAQRAVGPGGIGGVVGEERVEVAHQRDRDADAAGAQLGHGAEDAAQRGAGRQRDGVGALDRGAVGEGVAEPGTPISIAPAPPSTRACSRSTVSPGVG